MKRTKCMKGDCPAPPEPGTYYCAAHHWYDCTVEDFRAHQQMFDAWMLKHIAACLAIFVAVVILAGLL
jgi:hypothetical protein